MRIRRLFSILAPLALVASLAAAQSPALVPVGGEIRVNTTTADEQAHPDVAMDDAGNFVVVWDGGLQFLGDLNIFAQRYDASGTPLGSEFQVNTFTADNQSNPRVAMDGAGNFVVVWMSRNQIPPAVFSLLGRRYDSAGNPIGGEFEISVGQSAFSTQIAMAADGSFLVLWEGRPAGDFELPSVYFRLYDGNGSPQAPARQVSTSGFFFSFDVAALPDGGWTVIWQGFGTDGIRAQRYDAGGAPLGPEIRVADFANSLGIAAGGDRIVAALEGGPEGGPIDFLFDGSFTPLAGPLQVSTRPTQRTQNLGVAMDGAGRFVTAWVEFEPSRDGSATSVLARAFDAAGNPLGADFVLSTTVQGGQFDPRLAMSPAGRLVATWIGPDANFFKDVFAQVYVPNATPQARCRNLTVSAGPSCTAGASIDNGSFDPDGADSITLAQSPAGPYALGATGVTLTVTDNHGAASSCAGTVTVADATPPAISCPAAISTGGNQTSNGAVVPFTVSATDSCDTSVSVVTTPPSGSLFPFGTTPVSATATDDSGNNASCSFTVTVLSPQDQIASLIAEINALVTGGTLAPNKANPLITKLEGVSAKLDASQVGAACNQLGAFLNQVNAYIGNGTLTAAQGQALIDATNAIQANIGC